ncbi:16S rRNA (adenine(1518)-N(6)/adenine(1519)-N(6))-dimethyltransferase RsmA [Terricaulis sp.]|uniref:16S rRNA (adenine(1518)-N(6)/adenine(1519)-N(6))- dimethyltransferase RsmA n=1 Tax=Terricaulis sp. TaxID=2768686 RepID=UPI0037836D59
MTRGVNADDLPTLRDELEAHGLWANKGLGQHFLLDLNITRRIARTAGDLDGKRVLEVGPGPGGLTRALLEAGAEVVAVEKDARFLPLLEPLIAWSDGRLTIVNDDALMVDEAALLKGERAAVISNLPYNVGTPLLVKWLKAGAWRGDMTLMFQKEVAQRIVAKPGGDAYGRLAVLTQARCDARLEFIVPARAFTPPPKISSAIVRLTDRADAYAHLDALERVTAAAFGQRRKMLRSALKSLTPEAETLLAQAELAPTARAEEIDQAGFRRLAEAWRSNAA